MAVFSNRYPSPMSTRPRSPNPRTSETNSTIRRSLSGNPFARPSILTNPRSFNPNTPANSPVDIGRKHHVGKGSALRGFELKENEKDLNTEGVKFKSPSKGSKNFMSPTISAASKFFTPSPRKKILGERNESIRTSISFSDGKEALLEDLATNSAMGLNQSPVEGLIDKKDVVLEVPSLPKASKRVTVSEVPLYSHSDSESSSEITMNSDCVNLGFSRVPLNSHNDSEYLTDSFPCVNVESTSKKPEVPSIHKVSKGETFIEVPLNSQKVYNESESSISEITMNPDSGNVDSSLKIKPYSSPATAPLDADPSFPPYDPKTNYLSPRPQFLHYKPNRRIESILNIGLDFEEEKGLENFSDTDVTEETQSGYSQKESEGEEEPLDSKVPISTPISSHMPEQTFEAKGATKPGFFTRSKCISLLLVLLIACVSISVSDIPVTYSPMLEDSGFYNLYDSSEVAVFAKENFDRLARNFEQWSSRTLSYLSKLLLYLGEVDKLGTVQYCNLTGLQEHSFVGGYFEVKNNIEQIVGNHEVDEVESVEEGETEIVPWEEKSDSEDVAYEHNEEESEGQASSEIKEEQQIQAEMNDNESSEEILDQEQSETAALIDADQQSNIELEDRLPLTSQAPEIRPEIETFAINPEAVTSLEVQVDNDNSFSPETFTEMAVSDVVDYPTHVIEDEFSGRIILGIPSLVIAIVVATTFAYMKQGKNTTTLNDVVNQKTTSSPILAEHIHQYRPFSQNRPTDFDVVGESCPSGMSSFQKTSSYDEGSFRGTDQAQSLERKARSNTRPESLATSSEYSLGSTSYGSFTTYERIPVRHASGDEEIVTPVRRSSRIRSQVTSP